MKPLWENYFNKKSNDDPVIQSLESIPVFDNLTSKEFHEIKITEDNARRYQTIWVKKCWQFHNLMVELNEITSEKFLPEGVFYKVSPSSSGNV